MNNCGFQTLGSLEATHPVFLIVMGVFILLVAWRLSKISGAWTARCLMAGALLLTCGYSFLLPLSEAGKIERYSPARRNYHDTSAANALAWQAVKLVVMNTGWLVFGLGLAMHVKILSPRVTPRIQRRAHPLPPHELIARTHSKPRPAV